MLIEYIVDEVNVVSEPGLANLSDVDMLLNMIK